MHTLPALFVIASALMVLLALVWHWWAIVPLAVYALLLWASALWQTRSLKVAVLAVAASFVQLTSYGWGFIKAYVWKILLGHGRDEAQEIAMRKGK